MLYLTLYFFHTFIAGSLGKNATLRDLKCLRSRALFVIFVIITNEFFFVIRIFLHSRNCRTKITIRFLFSRNFSFFVVGSSGYLLLVLARVFMYVSIFTIKNIFLNLLSIFKLDQYSQLQIADFVLLIFRSFYIKIFYWHF